jgi:hypothetical protein
MLQVASSGSTGTGVAPAWLTASQVAMNGVRRDDHLVARADAPRAQDEVQRVEAVGDADRVRGAAVGGELALEGLDLGAEDVAARSEDAFAGLPQRGEVGRVDAAEVEERQGDQCLAHRARMNSA